MSMLHGMMTLHGNSDIFVITNAKPFGTPINISNNPGGSLESTNSSKLIIIIERNKICFDNQHHNNLLISFFYDNNFYVYFTNPNIRINITALHQ